MQNNVVVGGGRNKMSAGKKLKNEDLGGNLKGIKKGRKMNKKNDGKALNCIVLGYKGGGSVGMIEIAQYIPPS